MNQIPFATISIEEARATFLSDFASPASPQRQDWNSLRQPDAEENHVLSAAAYRWLASLPAESRPDILARRYPRIVNRMADIWQEAPQCKRYLNELMIDHRGNRQGFPRKVAAEIAAVTGHFLSTADTAQLDVWGNRIDAGY